MNPITIIWSMTASVCLTMALMHGFIWFRQREAQANLVFAIMAAATATMAGCELAMMLATTTEVYGSAMRWLHLPAWFVIISVAGFIRLYLRTGRTWLFWGICGLRTLTLVLDFLFSPNINYREITRLQMVSFLGQPVPVAEGIPNHWMLLGQASLVLLLIFVVDATVSAWRHGDRRRALIVGGSVVVFVAIAAGEATLALWGILHWPIISSLSFLIPIAAMGYELSNDALRATRLARDLQTSEAKISLAANAAGVRFWEWDIGRDELWAVNEKQISAKSRQNGLCWFLKSLHPDDREPVIHAVAKSMNGEGDYDAEYRVISRDGQTRWLVARGRVEFNHAGKPLWMRGVLLDITSRKKIEQALRESENRFRILADHAPVLIWMSGPDKLCVFFNKGWLDFTGRTLEQELGNGWAGGVHPEDFDSCLETYNQAFDARREFIMEYRLRRHDGEYHWILDKGVPRYGPDGAFLGYIGSCIDINGPKQAEQELAQQRNELAHLSRVTMLGELSGSFAHELNQPLASILSNAQAAQRLLTRESPDVVEVRDILTDIVAEDRRAGEIIRRLRNLFQRGAAALAPLSMNELVAEVLNLTHDDLIRRDIAPSWNLPSDLPLVNGDRVQLQQVTLNLILNAADAMSANPPGARSLQITGRAVKNTVRISVRDEGHGLPGDVERLFQPFYTTKPQGLGLGLAICRSIITVHQGRLWAEPHPERGAIFHFELPNLETRN